jgi:iron complex outermembrane recepter protein
MRGILILLLAGSAAIAEVPEEIIVSASRFRQPLLEYSGSASRLDRQELESRGATHYADLLGMVPGVLAQRGSGQEGLLAIRSPVLTGAGACGAFLLLEDGLPLRPPGFCNVNELFEVNTDQAGAIEVLRGPGSAAFGANAVHGIVNVLGRDPASLARPGLTIRWGSLDLQELGLEWTGTTGADIESGVHGFWRHDGGFRAASGTDEGKLQLILQGRGTSHRWTWRTSGSVLNQETAGFIRGFDSYRDRSIARSNANPEAFRDATSIRTALQVESEQSCTGCRRSLHVIARSTDMRFLQHFLLGKPLEENGHVSLGIGAQWQRTHADRHRLQWGLDLSEMRVRLAQSQPGPTLEGSAAARAIRPAGRHYDYRVAGSTASANAALALRLTARQRLSLQVQGGATRYRYDNRMLDGNVDESGASCGFGGCLYNRPGDRRDSFADAAARIEWQYLNTADRRWYLALARGFRPPETTELYRLQRGQDVARLDSESMLALETGLRVQSQALSLHLAAFAQKKRNVLLRDANGFNIDGGRTRHHGIEYDLEWRPTRAWQLSLGGSWAVHRYAFSRAIEGGETVIDGRDIDTAPRHLLNAQLRWQAAGSTNVGVRIQHVGRYFVDAANQRSYPGHVVAGIWLDRPFQAGHSINLNVENLFDRRYADRADFAQNEYRYFPAAGRQVLLRYTWKRP